MSFFSELKRRNVLRVGAAYLFGSWLLIQVAETIFPLFGYGDTPARLVVIVLVIAFLPALVFSWFFEITPDGLKRDAEVDREHSITQVTGKKIDRVILLLMTVALGYFAVDKFVLSPAKQAEQIAAATELARQEGFIDAVIEQSDDKSIAVLPFINMSDDKNNEYFSDGISEEILNSLAKIPDLKVTGRTSSFAFKGDNQDLRSIGETLGVSHILEGSVRKDGKRVRIMVQLINTRDGFQLWSETYQRELTDIFVIQKEIAVAIAESLKVSLQLSESKALNLVGTTNMQAYDAYLRGINQWHRRSNESLLNSIELFEKAVAIDPGFARAYAGLALTYAVIDNYSDIPTKEARNKTKLAAEQALVLDPELVEAATALILTTDDVNTQLVYAEKAIAMNASFATARQWYAAALAVSGDLEAAEREYLAASYLDPRSTVIADGLIYLYFTTKRWDEAERLINNQQDWAPGHTFALRTLFLINLAQNDRQGAREVGESLVAANGKNENKVDVYLEAFFDPDKRREATQELLGWFELDVHPPDNPGILTRNDIIYFLAWIGDFDNAREQLMWSIENQNVYFYGYYRVDRTMPEFVCDPATQSMFDQAGLVPLRVPYPCMVATQ